MRVVSVISLKGGVGKTSVTLGLAGAAWDNGVRTLVVDLDPQGNATTVLDPPAVSLTAADALDDPTRLPEAIVTSGWGPEIHVLPSAGGLEQHNAPISGDADLRLRVGLSAIGTAYDLVLIDSPPSLAGLTRNALAASHVALVVAEPSLFALQGARAAIDSVSIVRKRNLRLGVAGILVNKLRGHSVEHRYRLAELQEAYGDLVLEPPVPDRTAIQQAEGACVPVQAWRSPGAREVSDAFEDHLDRLLNPDS